MSFFLVQLCNARLAPTRLYSTRLSLAWLYWACCAAVGPFVVLFNYAYYCVAATVTLHLLSPLQLFLLVCLLPLRSCRDECECLWLQSAAATAVCCICRVSVLSTAACCTSGRCLLPVHFICGLPGISPCQDCQVVNTAIEAAQAQGTTGPRH